MESKVESESRKSKEKRDSFRKKTRKEEEVFNALRMTSILVGHR
jgi:hypothetical protein